MTESELRATLASCDGDLTATAQYLGVTTRTIYRYMKRYGIRRRMVYEQERCDCIAPEDVGHSPDCSRFDSALSPEGDS